jgi:hypothetical protein
VLGWSAAPGWSRWRQCRGRVGGGSDGWSAALGGDVVARLSPARRQLLYYPAVGLRVDLCKHQGLFCKNALHESPTTACGQR